MTIIAIGFLSWLTIGALLLLGMYGRVLAAIWREPVLRAPVLIIESDDWGAGPRDQARQLARIGAMLDSYRDRRGKAPVMTLGIVLGVADGARMLADGLRGYYRKHLDDPEFAPIVDEMKLGVKMGVFALQLHGAEHYWPPALLAAARTIPEVAAWLAGSETPRTEGLPSSLQSRWIDAAALPSKQLLSGDAQAAALAEVESFHEVFGIVPTVAVPPTFIWNEAVETGWAKAGIQIVITPGRRYESRDSKGNPIGVGSLIVNGEGSTAGITYLVRDDYFEPARGHTAERGLAAVRNKTRVGRPTLLETHRANFLGDAMVAEQAIIELGRLIASVLQTFPDLVFTSPEQLASRMQQRDPELVERRLAVRLHIWLLRSWKLSRLRKLAFVTGVIIPGWLLFVGTRRGATVPQSVHS